MKRSKYTDEQFLAIVKESEVGRKVAGPVSRQGDHRADVLPLDRTIRRHGAERDATPEQLRT
jgi:hypothetical protein